MTVIAGNDSPVAAAGPDRTAAVREDIPFDGSGSFDPDGAVTGYQWDFGDGRTGSGISVTHPYKKAGTYTVSLTVTDDQGATSPPDTALVTVIR